MSNSVKSEIEENLPKLFKNVFADYFIPDNCRALSSLLSLVAYYVEDDFSKEMLRNCNRLRANLVQIEQLESIMNGIARFSNFHCDFSRDPRSQIAPNYTFSPQIPDFSNICITVADKTETIKKELAEIDTFSICMYVRKKAVAAGDL